MTESLVDRLNASSGFETFTAGDGKPSLRPNTRLMKEAADRIANLERALNVSTGRRAAGASRAATMTDFLIRVLDWAARACHRAAEWCNRRSGHDDGGNDG